MFYAIILLIAVLLVGSVGYEFNQNREETTSKIEMRRACEMWDCDEPIPTELDEECQTIDGCIKYCEDIGARMYCNIL